MDIKIKVSAGNHDRHNCPVFFTMKKRYEDFSLVDQKDQEIPFQVVDCGEQVKVVFLLEKLNKGQEMILRVIPKKADLSMIKGVKLMEKDKKVDIDIEEKYFTSYVFDESFAKPYLGPIMNPHENSFTRLDFEVREHPHHRSMWIAIGDVNGVDFWNEPKGQYGKQQHQGFSELYSGKVYGRLTATNLWVNYKDKPIVDETRTLTFYNTPSDIRIIDVKIVFRANYGRVEFGATKEAGPLGVRLAEPLKVNNGGTMINSYGGMGEDECWGKRAQWCDYYGKLNDAIMGVAVFDNPENMDYPTYWHIRNYGLMAPNNFYFVGGKLLKPGQVATYQYRLIFHQGSTKDCGIAEQYHNYINPPIITQLGQGV